MRSLFELVAKLLFPSHGRHRADSLSAAPVLPQPQPVPVRRLVRSAAPVLQIIDGDATATVRPYVLAAEGADW
ncbi:hypothetical protein [Streptomyces halobius]|uniref:Uncharacterized protein n=1 Tax=Streptomyces halobius TaxID=2879846 RepID=A0ABY4M715_9ACTN|nr:hypothetical protein [Streptomyces halobius]UQA93473.1 hypothetical protein K9S39_17905 [Streptomyces halobius]